MTFFEIGDKLRCVFAGRLDGIACSEIELELLQRVTAFRENREKAYLTFDLAEVVFISSAFLRLCLILFKTFGKDCFAITNVSEDIHKVFHISGFADIMHVKQKNAVTEKAG